MHRSLILSLISVSLVFAQLPQVSAGGVVNGASFVAGITPGSIASVFGSNFGSSVNGTVVRVDGIVAYLFAVSPQQINLQVPWEIAGQTQASFVVVVNGAASTPVVVPLVRAAPGIFMLSPSQGAVSIANVGVIAAPLGTFSGSRPALRGEFLSIYCTGLGSVSNQPQSGVPSSGALSLATETPTVTIGGSPASVIFSGIAPGFIGLYQINVEVPRNATAGEAVPISISVGGRTSNTASIAISAPPPAPATIYAASGLAIFKRRDGDSSWTRVGSLPVPPPSQFSLFPEKANVVVADSLDSSTFYAGTGAGISKSTDAGQHWGPSSGIGSVVAIAIPTSLPSTIYAGVNITGGGIYKSTDSGGSWTAVNSGLEAVSEARNRITCIAVDPQNPLVLYAGTSGSRVTGIFKTTNGGAAWNQLPSSLSFGATRIVVDSTNSSVVYALGSFGHIYKSTNAGATWTSITFTFSSTIPQVLAVSPANASVLYLGTDFGLYRSSNAGLTWAQVGISVGYSITSLRFDTVTPNLAYAGTNSDIFKSADGGVTWSVYSAGLNDGPFISIIVAH